MGKRFRDTEIWGKEWFVGLTCAERCAIDYILCHCDTVGVWPPAFSVAERLIGEKIDWEALPNKTNGNIKVLGNGKWYVTDFITFQYGKLRESCAPHRSYLSLLEKHGLLEGYCKGSHTLKEKEIEKEKEKEIEKEKEQGYQYPSGRIEYLFDTGIFRNISDEQVESWAAAYPALDIETELAKASAWLRANPNKKKQNYHRFLVNWFSRAQERGGDKKYARK